MRFTKRQNNLDGRKVGDEMDREKVIAQCEWAIKQTSSTIIESKTFYEEVLALLKEQEAKIEQLNRFVNGFSRDAIPVVRCKDCKYYDYFNGCIHG